MPNPVPKGPAAKNQKKADAIAGGVLKEVFQPDLGRGQFTDAHKQTLINSINCKLTEQGFPGNYTIKRLDAWLSNTLYRYRMAQKKRKPPSWQPKREKGAMALLDLTTTTSDSSKPTKKRPRYPNMVQDVATTDSAVAKAAAAAAASAAAAAARRQVQAEVAAKAAAAAKVQADLEAAAVARSAAAVTGSPALLGAAGISYAAESATALSFGSSQLGTCASPRNISSDTLLGHSLSPTPGLITILGRRLNSPVTDLELAAGTNGVPKLTRHDTRPLNEADLAEQATYEGVVFAPLENEASRSSLPGRDERARVLKRTPTQEAREQDPSSTVSTMPDRSAFVLRGHLKRRDTDPYVLSQLKREGAVDSTEAV